MKRRRNYVLDPSEMDDSPTCSPEAALMKLLITLSLDVKEIRYFTYKLMHLPVGEWKKKRIRHIG